MTGHIPFFPLMGVLVSIAGICGAILLIDHPGQTPDLNIPVLRAERYTPGVTEPLLVYHDQVRANGDAQIILNQSPFSKTRTPFSRVRNTSTPRPESQPAVKLDPRLLGVVETEQTRRAVLIWRAGEEAVEVTLGEDTPLGKVTAISSNEVQFERDGDTTTLSLF